MKYLLDTCVVSDFVKGQAKILARVKATSPKLIAVSALTRMEVEHGLALNAARARKLAPMLDAFFATIVTLPFDEADAKAAATIRCAQNPRPANWRLRCPDCRNRVGTGPGGGYIERG